MYDNHFSNFGRPPIPNDLCKISAPRHKVLKVFTIYGHGGHLCQRTATILAILCSPQLKEDPCEIRGKLAQKSFENVNGRTDRQKDGRRTKSDQFSPS